ncbi:baeRF7 domain-containing protein [Halocola ammonii]
MYLFSEHDFKNLHKNKAETSVSIFVPMEVAGNYEKNRIGYKNAVKNVEERLEKRGTDREIVEKILEQLASLQDNKEFWENQSEGLAVFATADFMKYFELPIKFEAFEYISDHFYLRSLSPMLSGNGEFFILNLTKDNVKLYEATKYSIAEIDTTDLDAESIVFQEELKDTSSLQHHSSGQTIYHGHGAPDDQDRQDIERYFRKLSDELDKILKYSDAPLMVACVDYLYPIFKEKNNYQHLIDDHLSGNYEHKDLFELHEEAWDVVKDRYESSYEKAREEIGELRSKDRVTDDIKSIFFNAQDGNIEKLYIKNGQEQWGNFDAKTGEVALSDNFEEGSTDLLNLAAISTVENSGKVQLIDEQYLKLLGTDNPALAVLRY